MVATERPAIKFNRSLLSSFVSPTKEFEEFVRNRIPILSFRIKIKKFKNGFSVVSSSYPAIANTNVKISANIEKIYRKLIQENFDYVVSNQNYVYFCNKSNFKQLLFNIRSKKINSEKRFFKNISKERYAFFLKNLQMKKVHFSKNFIISVFSLRENKYVTYRPFFSTKSSPKKKHLIAKTPEFI
jgi:hypothetical protein